MMKIGIIREGKTPPDRRVPLSPKQCIEVQERFPGTQIVVQPSDLRCFRDEEYRAEGIVLQEDLNDCNILLGVKEVDLDDLLESKKYLFFSHTIKKQPYNRGLLQTILKKKITLIDYETLTDKNGMRIIGFGRYAGMVGAYSGIRAVGLKTGKFNLKPAFHCEDLNEMLIQLDEIKLPPVKIVVTGDGRVAGGVVEILDYMKIARLEPDIYLEIPKLPVAVYTQLLPGDYVRRDNGYEFDLMHFFLHPAEYENAFLPFAASTDMLISAAYWDPKAPVLFTKEDAKSKSFKISVISDITCDINGSVPTTMRPATIEEPFYDYNCETGELELPFSSPKNITIQAVDNLPCELPKDASVEFGRNLIEKVFPGLFGPDNDGIIDRATIARNGKLTARFSYLQGFVDGE